MNSVLQKVIKSWRHFFMAFSGTCMIGVAVALMTAAHLGTDPFTDFVTGVAYLFDSTYGTFYLIVIGLLMVVIFFWDKRKIGIATVINLFVIGNICTLCLKPLTHFFPEPLIWQRILFLVLALVILCVASSLYYVADLGVSSYDAIAIILSEKTRFQFRWCRVFTDLICVGVGFAFGADVGVGTVLTAFCMGPFTQWCVVHIAEPMLEGKKRID